MHACTPAVDSVVVWEKEKKKMTKKELKRSQMCDRQNRLMGSRPRQLFDRCILLPPSLTLLILFLHFATTVAVAAAAAIARHAISRRAFRRLSRWIISRYIESSKKAGRETGRQAGSGITLRRK